MKFGKFHSLKIFLLMGLLAGLACSETSVRASRETAQKHLMVIGQVSGGSRPVVKELVMFDNGVMRLGTPSGKNPKGYVTLSELAWFQTYLDSPGFMESFEQAGQSAFQRKGIDQPRFYLRINGQQVLVNFQEIPPGFRTLLLKLRPLVHREFRVMLFQGLNPS